MTHGYGGKNLIRHRNQNGLRIVYEQIPFVRSVSIGIWILTGSRNETDEQNGLSHFLEHMLFKGTERLSAQDIAEAFDAIGAEINAFTAKEYTCYYVKVLENHKEVALNILAEMFFHSTFKTEEINRERNVILEEIKMVEDTADDIIHDLLARAAYRDHSLARPILGNEQNVRNFNRENFQTYMNNHYNAENIVISIAGNVKEDFIYQVETAFSPLKGKSNKATLAYPTFYQKQTVKYKDTEQAHLCLGYQGLALNDDYFYDLVLLNNILGASMSSRLFQEVREKRGLAYSVYSFHETYLDSGMLTIYAGTSSSQVKHVEQTIADTITELLHDGITTRELNNNKENLKGSIILDLEDSESIMSRNGKNELLLQSDISIDEMITRIDSISKTSIQHVIETLFSKQPASAIILPRELE